MVREDVFRLVSEERDYQDSLMVHKLEEDAEASVAAWITYMENQLAKAKQAVYDLSDSDALEQVRKITALGVACMEHNDTKPRK